MEISSGDQPARRERLDPSKATEWVIGRRRECALWLDDPAVSRRHAKIELLNSEFVLADNGSRNGSRLNGAEVAAPAPLRDGDRIEVCDHQLRFRQQGMEGGSVTIGNVTWIDTGAAEPAGVQLALDVSHASIGARPTPQVALDAVLELTRSLGRMEPSDLLRRLLDVAFRVLPAANRGVVFALRAEDRIGDGVDRWIDALQPIGHLVRDATSGEAVDGSGQDEIRISRSVLRLALKERQAVMSSHAAGDQRVDSSASLLALEVQSWLCVPILDPADDLPIGVIELLGVSDRVRFEAGDLELVSALAAAAAVAVQNAAMLADRHRDALERDRRARDLEHAREIQRSFLPRGVPPVSNYRFAAHYQAAQSIGGDYYVLDVLPGPQPTKPSDPGRPVRGRKVAIGVGDVSGKGLPAALLMARLSSDMRFALLSADRSSPSPSAALRWVNESLRGNAPESRFVTLCLGVLDTGDHSFRYGNCGHSPALVRRADGTIEELADAPIGVPLNVLDSTRAADGVTTLGVGDLVLLSTDGLTEARNPAGDEFGESGVRRALERCGGDPERLAADLIRATDAFADGIPPRDDMTFVCCSRLE